MLGGGGDDSIVARRPTPVVAAHWRGRRLVEEVRLHLCVALQVLLAQVGDDAHGRVARPKLVELGCSCWVKYLVQRIAASRHNTRFSEQTLLQSYKSMLPMLPSGRLAELEYLTRTIS